MSGMYTIPSHIHFIFDASQFSATYLQLPIFMGKVFVPWSIYHGYLGWGMIIPANGIQTRAAIFHTPCMYRILKGYLLIKHVELSPGVWLLVLSINSN